jgi:cysteine-rich repeat protein
MFECPQRLSASILLSAALLTFGCPGSTPDHAACGDGVVEGPEVCDDGNAVTELACAYGTRSCTACDAACTRSLSLVGAYCGDGVLNAAEPCDDGDAAAGDGCSSACEIEAGYDCFEPTGCVVAPVLVRTTSGALAPLDGTTWSHCEADSPTTGQSVRRTDAFAWPEVARGEDVYTASTDCSGPTDPAAHRIVRTVVIAVTDRTVGWKDAPPAGLDAQVIATGLTFADPTTREVVLRDVRLLDAAAMPLLVYAGYGDGPRDADGFPTQLEPTPTEDQLFGDLQGTWTSCIDEPAPSTDTFETMTISAADVFSERGPSTSSDGTCSGAYTPLETMLGTMSLGLGVQATLGSSSVTARAVDVSTVDGTFYSIIHLDESNDPDLLYTGDQGATAGLDGSAPDRRPTVLESWKPRRKGDAPPP